jgi:hypothetical protein
MCRAYAVLSQKKVVSDNSHIFFIERQLIYPPITNQTTNMKQRELKQQEGKLLGRIWASITSIMKKWGYPEQLVWSLVFVCWI